MAPQILHRVIHGQAKPEPWQKAMLRFQPAVLHGYRRHRVQGADYPGIVPVGNKSTTTEESSASETNTKTSVIGTLVSGLTDGDIYRLDKFEGSEYEKKPVVVRTLRALIDDKKAKATPSDSQLRDVLDAVDSRSEDEGDEVTAVTYVYTAGDDMLEDAEWDFESFKRDKMAWWINADESQW